MLHLAFQGNSGELSPGESAALTAGFLMMIGLMLLVVLAINIVICLLLYKAQSRVPAQHRKIEPGLVWLLLIPLFQLVWNFFVFLRVPESYQSHFQSQGRADTGDCGRTIGLWYSICAAASVVPCVNYAAGPAALVLLIIFLVKLHEMKNQIAAAAMV